MTAHKNKYFFLQIVGEALQAQMKVNYQASGSHKEKTAIAKAITGSIIDHHQLNTKFQKEIAPVLRNTNLKSADKSENCKKTRRTSEAIQKQVEEFLMNNSKVDPCKSRCKKVGDEFTPRYNLNGSLIDLHRQFCEEHDTSIALSTFCKYRPKHCVAQKFSERDTCACPKHTNFQFLIDVLFKQKVIKQTTTHQFVRSLTCDKTQDQCFERTCINCKEKFISYDTDLNIWNKEVTYKKWININNEKRISAKTGKMIKVSYVKMEEVRDKIVNIVNLIKHETAAFLLHEMRIFHEYHEKQKIVTILQEDETVAFLSMDFSENYTCKYAKEIQATHYGASKQQISLHTCYLYTSEFNKGCVTVSQNLSHDACSVLAHLIEALRQYEFQLIHIKHLHLRSDSVSSQYRNKTIFYLITQILPDYYPQIDTITHHYTEANHGKDPVDGIGATCKRESDSQVTHGVDVPNLNKFVTAISSKLKNIAISTVETEDIEGIEKVLQENETKVKTFAGTTKVHQYTWKRTNPYIVHFNSLSCSKCPPGENCVHYHLGSMNYAPSGEDKVKSKGKPKILNIEKLPGPSRIKISGNNVVVPRDSPKTKIDNKKMVQKVDLSKGQERKPVSCEEKFPDAEEEKITKRHTTKRRIENESITFEQSKEQACGSRLRSLRPKIPRKYNFDSDDESEIY